MSDIKEKINRFNRDICIGSLVVRVDDFGNRHNNITTSKAWHVCGSGLVKLKGISGGYNIDRISLISSADDMTTSGTRACVDDANIRELISENEQLNRLIDHLKSQIVNESFD